MEVLLVAGYKRRHTHCNSSFYADFPITVLKAKWSEQRTRNYLRNRGRKEDERVILTMKKNISNEEQPVSMNFVSAESFIKFPRLKENTVLEGKKTNDIKKHRQRPPIKQ